jgi:hypothetical protein
VPVLLDTRSAVRFLSCEPLLGPVDLVGQLCQAGEAKMEAPMCLLQPMVDAPDWPAAPPPHAAGWSGIAGSFTVESGIDLRLPNVGAYTWPVRTATGTCSTPATAPT